MKGKGSHGVDGVPAALFLLALVGSTGELRPIELHLPHTFSLRRLAFCLERRNSGPHTFRSHGPLKQMLPFVRNSLDQLVFLEIANQQTEAIIC